MLNTANQGALPGPIHDICQRRSPETKLQSARPKSARSTRIDYYTTYYANVTSRPASLPAETAQRHTRGENSQPYYDGYYLTFSSSLSEQDERNEIARQWQGEIERYIKMGGDKERFIDFISAAKTGFPDERDEDANDKVRLFREDYIRRATPEDIAHVMALHENIRSRLERARQAFLVEGDVRTYRECTGRIGRLDRGRLQLQGALKRKRAELE